MSNTTTRLTILICSLLVNVMITAEAFGQGSFGGSKIDQQVMDALTSQTKVFVLVHFGASPSSADITSVADIARPNSASEVYEMHALGMVAAEIDNATINQIAAQRSVTQITIDPVGTVLMPEAGPFILTVPL